jgi:glycosyltransferase involved in cell wall biosynthesis
VLIGIDASRASVAQKTGTERYAVEIIRALVAAAPDDRFRLYFNRPPAPGLLPQGHNARWRVIPSPRLWTVGRLSLELAMRPPDVLFVPAHSLPPVLPRASVATVHDLGYLHFPGEHPRMTRWLRRQSNAWSARRATRVIAISGATRDDLIRREGIDVSKISVVRHGHAPTFRPIDDTALLEGVARRHGLDGRYLLFVGTLQPRKNLARLLAAFDLLAATDPSISLALVGAQGWHPERLTRALAGLRSRDRVRVLGYVDDADLPTLMSGAVALAFPSLYEGFGLPALEAMACGTPVLASTTSSLPEVVGDAGLLVDPLDVDAIAAGLARLVADDALRGELRDRGLARAASFTWARAAQETLTVLRAAEDAARR